MKRGRNDPCWCNSGRKYKHCHYVVDAAKGRQQVPIAQQFYNQRWQKNAANIASQGCYEWIASRLDPFVPKRILDIGCGDGSGLLALLDRFKADDLHIISLDENRKCLQAANDRLRSKGYNVTAIYRLLFEPVGSRQHQLYAETGKLMAGQGVTLIETDLLVDPELNEFLDSLPPFDAVTLWFIGTHDRRFECVNLDPLEIRSPADYRLRVQNEAYELAERVLRSGGGLQIVDRTQVPETEDQIKEFLNLHREQAAVTSLQVQNELEFMAYVEVKGVDRIQMIPNTHKRSGVTDTSRMAVASVISIKP